MYPTSPSNVIVSETTASTATVLLLSDPHWDNPHCDRIRLKRDLDTAVKLGARIAINGDLLCLMMGRYDPRGNKSSIRPEHNRSDYLDAVVNTAVDWWLPYAEHIDFIGVGNHESNILKRLETDPLARLVELLNLKAGTNIRLGGYGGWYVVRFTGGGSSSTYKIKYMHGFGGGGPVTKGVIQHQRMAAAVEDADAIWMGHVHEDYELTYTREYLRDDYTVGHRDVLMLRTATYKEEFGDGSQGWHVERGSPPKPTGSRLLHIERRRDRSHGGRGLHTVAWSQRLV